MGLIFFAFFEKFFVPILTSGGPASFIMPLQIGKTPIVVPRQHQFNEHVNDHQVEFARNVAKRMGTIIEVENKNDLVSAMTLIARVLRVALVIAINVILYKLLVGKYIMNGWGEWIMYAVIASIIVLVTTGLIYFITEKNSS